MKKQILAAAFVLGFAASAFAAMAPGTGVMGSPHDMNVTSTGPDAQGRVCAFCHTPHHAIDLNTATAATYLPLWSHTVNNDVNFTAYGTGDGNIPFSPTLQLTYEPDILVGPSRLCFSCHDGVIAVDQHYATAGGDVRAAQDGWNQISIAATDSLSNDHPIGFDYTAVAGAVVKGTPNPAPAAGTDPYINPASSTYGIPGFPNTNAPTLTIQDRLYNGNIMTCATCHDVHNRKNATNIQGGAGVNYFVLAPQDSSALCQTCHIK